MIDCTSPGNWISPSHLTDHFLPATGTIPLTELVWPKGVSGGVDWCLSTSLSQAVSPQLWLSLHTQVKRHRRRRGSWAQSLPPKHKNEAGGSQKVCGETQEVKEKALSEWEGAWKRLPPPREGFMKFLYIEKQNEGKF